MLGRDPEPEGSPLKLELVRRTRTAMLACGILLVGLIVAWFAARVATGATPLAEGPGAALWAGGKEVDLYYRSDDGGLSQGYYVSGRGWGGPTAVPHTAGQAASGPSVVLDDGGKAINQFFRNTAGGVSQTYFASGTGWHGPRVVPGTSGKVLGAPATTLSQSGKRLDVFFRGTDGGIWHS